MNVKIITRDGNVLAFVDGYNVSKYFKQGPAAIIQTPNHIVVRSKYKSITKQIKKKWLGWIVFWAVLRRTFNIYGIKKTKEGYYVNISYEINES